MFQQTIAILIIIYFLNRLYWQKKKNIISVNEFNFWLIFWLLGGVVVASIKWIDRLVLSLGFSGSGIQIILYLAVAVMFYFLFKQRIRIEKIERDITKIIREMALREKEI